jgi:anti-sigma factor RsiW
MRGAWLILAGLMALLSALGLLAVGLSFMTYEGPAAWDSATPMLVLGFLGALATVACWVMARRPQPAPRASGWVASPWSEHTWHRRYRLPAWTDWFSLLFPAGITLGLAGGALHSLETQTAPVTHDDVAGAVGATLLVGFLLFGLVALRRCERGAA